MIYPGDSRFPVILALPSLRGLQIMGAESADFICSSSVDHGVVKTTVELTVRSIVNPVKIPAHTTHCSLYFFDAVEGTTIVEMLDVDLHWRDSRTIVGSTDRLHQIIGPTVD